MKTLVIGDIHGCYTELSELLEKTGLSENDSIIALGDLIDRGPDSPAVLQFFQNHSNRHSLLGNHERKHILASQGLTELSVSQLLVRQQFGEKLYMEALNFMKSLPLYIELQEAILVHGQFEPGVALVKQQESVLTGSMSGEKYLSRKYNQPWYLLYNNEKPIIAGHYDYSKSGKPLIIKNNVFFIDTGCCFGKSLTGLLLPDFKLITVKSHRNYWSLAMQSKRKK